MKKYLFFLGHPAHFHLFKHAIHHLKSKGNEVFVVIKSKDILSELLDASGIPYKNLLPKGRKDGIVGIAWAAWQKSYALYTFCKASKPDVMLGTSAEIAWIGKILGIPSLVFNEDDAEVVKRFAQLVYPFATAIVSPQICDNGKWQSKTITYEGYQKLAYLHPIYFKPDENIIKQYIPDSIPYSILRFAKLNAHHDSGAQGFTNEIARKSIELMQQFGRVYITSEKELDPEFEQYRLNINPLHMHDILAFAQLYIGDSQSMAVEAALLGVPCIRFSSFKGKINVLEELQFKYALTLAVSPDQPEELYTSILKYLNPSSNWKTQLKQNRERMLAEKMNVSPFIVQLAEKYANKAVKT